MTQDRTIDDGTRAALVLNAIKRARGDGFDTAHWDVKTREAFHWAEEKNLMRGKHEFSRLWRYEITDLGVVVRDALGPKGLDVGMGNASSGDRAMWAWLLLNGGVVTSYGTIPQTTDDEYLHLISCGVDFDRSGPVRDDSWTTFAGTFADDERHTGVGGRATCLCDEVEGLDVVAEIESVTTLLRQVIA